MSPQQQLGKYRLLEILGSGGFATVYKAENMNLGNEVALKVMNAHLFQDEPTVARFKQEARFSVQLDHPNIVRVLDPGYICKMAQRALVIGIYDNGKENILYYGKISSEKNTAPDGNTVFEIGTLTETFTSILYADMLLKNLVNGDDKLKSFLPVNIPHLYIKKLFARLQLLKTTIHCQTAMRAIYGSQTSCVFPIPHPSHKK